MAQRRLLDKKTGFLKAFTETGSISFAARGVGVDRGQHYDWLKEDPSYRERFDDAKSKANVRLSAKALKAARKARALRDIADGASVRLLEQIADLINNSNGRPGRATHARQDAQAVTERDAREDLFNQIAREGVFGKKYKSYRDAPAEAQQTIRVVAEHVSR